jgi:hypothetical protein
VNTSLVRECLELILMLADALDRKQTKPPSTVSRQSLPVTPKVAPVVLGSETRVFACAFQLAWLRTLPATLVPRAGPVALWGLASCPRAVIFRGQLPSASRAL